MAVKWNGRQTESQVRAAAVKGVVKAGYLVHTAATDAILSGEKSGRVYQRRGVTHQASAPGQAPATDTGKLLNSISVIPDIPRVQARVNAAAKYAAALEFGTQRIEPRPFMRPALASNRAQIERTIAAEIRRVIG